jgi:hypothetical protein
MHMRVSVIRVFCIINFEYAVVFRFNRNAIRFPDCLVVAADAG